MTANSSKKPKRILVLSNRYYPHDIGGYSLSCKATTDELLKRGYDVHVMTSTQQAPKGQSADKVHRVLHLREPDGLHPVGRRWRHLHWMITGRIDRRVARHLIQSLAPDIVYVWNMGQISLSPIVVAQDLGVPLVFDLGDYWLRLRCRELCLEPDRLRVKYRLFVHGIGSFHPFQFTHMLTNSQVLKQSYVEVGFPAEHISVIPRGLQPRFIVDAPSPILHRSRIELLYAGRLTEAKGVHLAIQTIAILNRELADELHKPFHLDIIGDGDPSYVLALRELVVSLGLQQMVRFLGKTPQEELFDLYSRCDAVLVPSIWVEPFGNVVIEAMARGVCVIASERGGPAEHITHGQDGLLVPPEDPFAMARAVANLVQDAALRDRIRHNAIATVRRRYSIEKVVDQIEIYLSDALRSQI